MAILNAYRLPVKTCSLVKPRQPKTTVFGSGLFAFVPFTTIPHTASDEATYAAQQAEREAEMVADEREARKEAIRDYNSYLEERAMHSAYCDSVA